MVWPFKDCVLEGGMTKDDEKRKEIFFNEILAQDEIDKLFAPKVLTNWKRYTQNGPTSAKATVGREEKVKELKRDKDGVIQENLLIKGNNLLALHSLKKQFQGKVKLIYIDPPYNTGGDSNIFTYNNSFNHSAWLTFMKNRLEIGKQLLRNDGFIAIAIDHFELGYLLVLADEIFGRDNRLGIISVVNNPMGRNQAKYFSTINDYMVVYAKEQTKAIFNNVILDEEFYKTFNEKDSKGKYKLNNFVRIGGGDENLRINKKSFWYPLYVKPDLTDISTKKKLAYVEVFPISSGNQERTWKLSKNSTEHILSELVAKREGDQIVIYEKYRIEKGQKVPTIWSHKKYNANHQGIRLLESIIRNNNFSYPKSLYTVLDTLKIMTSKDDIILDFFAGSGTTGHATLKLNKEDGGDRKFILVEQLDEHIKICKERIQKVINSKDNFVYCELAMYNEKFVDEIKKAKNTKELFKIWDEMKEKSFLNYNVDIKKFDENLNEFNNFSLDKQKRILFDFLNKNQLYVNLSEIKDEEFKVDLDFKKINNIFYRV